VAIPQLVSKLVPISIIKKLYPTCDPDEGGNFKKLVRTKLLLRGEWRHTDKGNANVQKYSFMLGFCQLLFAKEGTSLEDACHVVGGEEQKLPEAALQALNGDIAKAVKTTTGLRQAYEALCARAVRPLPRRKQLESDTGEHGERREDVQDLLRAFLAVNPNWVALSEPSTVLDGEGQPLASVGPQCCFDVQEHHLCFPAHGVDIHVPMPPMSGVVQGAGPGKSTTGMWWGDVKYTIEPEDTMMSVDNRSTSVEVKLELSENKHDLSLVHELSEFEACAGQVVLRITRDTRGAASRTIAVVLTALDEHNKLPAPGGAEPHTSIDPFFSLKHQDAYKFELSNEGPLSKMPGCYTAGNLVIHLRCPKLTPQATS
jgi:hypothetical protein